MTVAVLAVLDVPLYALLLGWVFGHFVGDVPFCVDARHNYWTVLESMRSQPLGRQLELKL